MTANLVEALAYNVQLGSNWASNAFKVPLFLRHNSVAMRKNNLDQTKDKEIF